jgi:RNA polymerase sigma factor (TIGR02999 family)
MSAEDDLTGLLRAWSAGDKESGERLILIVYKELRQQAARYLSHERRDHTLRPTALVNEAYLRLIKQRSVEWHDRAHFFGVAATVMRRLLVDHARQHAAAKRGALRVVSLDEAGAAGEAGEAGAAGAAAAPGASDLDVIALNDALDELTVADPLRARMIELRFFGGLTTDETADALGVSSATVTRGWRLARAWLHQRLTKGPPNAV